MTTEEKLKAIKENQSVEKITSESFGNMTTYYLHLTNGARLPITDQFLEVMTMEKVESMITKELNTFRP